MTPYEETRIPLFSPWNLGKFRLFKIFLCIVIDNIYLFIRQFNFAHSRLQCKVSTQKHSCALGNHVTVTYAHAHTTLPLVILLRDAFMFNISIPLHAKTSPSQFFSIVTIPLLLLIFVGELYWGTLWGKNLQFAKCCRCEFSCPRRRILLLHRINNQNVCELQR